MNRCTSRPLQRYTGCHIFVPPVSDLIFSHMLLTSSLNEKVRVLKLNQGFLKSYLLIHVLYLIISRASAAHMSLCFSAYIKSCKGFRENQNIIKNCVHAEEFSKKNYKIVEYCMLCFIFSNGIHVQVRGGGLGSRPKKMYGERLGDGVEYHLMKPTPRR